MATCADLRQEIESVRLDYHRLLDEIPESAYLLPSANPAWTVGQVLFHMSLAARLLPGDVGIIKSRVGWLQSIPRLVPRQIFHWLNERHARIGGRRASRESLKKTYDQAHRGALQALESLSNADLTLGMEYPGWDPLLSGQVTLETLFRYLRLHFESHAGQVRQAIEG
ncbi:MAG: DinB family protein [Chloroflexota bacterium]